MSIEDAGRRLLGNVANTTLHDTLNLVRSIFRAGQPHTLFGIPDLDGLIPINHSLDLEQLEDNTQDYSDDEIIQTIIKKSTAHSPRVLVELTSSESCSAKSALIRAIIAQGVLPLRHHDCYINGKNGVIVIFDTDDRLDVVALRNHIYNVLKERIAQGREANVAEQSLYSLKQHEPSADDVEPSDDDELQEIVIESLKSIHILRPQTFQSLISSLDGLPAYLHQDISTKAIHSIILDSASVFYWQFKADQEARKLQALDAGRDDNRKPSESVAGYLTLVKKLHELSERFECTVVATTWDVAPPTTQPLVSRLNPTLPATPTVRLEVNRIAIRRFAGDVSVDRARAQEASRADVVTRHEFQITDGKEVILFSMRTGDVEVEEATIVQSDQ